jgi:hypothetical protein
VAAGDGKIASITMMRKDHRHENCTNIPITLQELEEL